MSETLFSHKKEDLINAARVIATELIVQIKNEHNLLQGEPNDQDILTQKECALF